MSKYQNSGVYNSIERSDLFYFQPSVVFRAKPKNYLDLIHYDRENYIKKLRDIQWLVPRNYDKLRFGGKILNHCRTHN